jgi:type II secretory pathway component GspD/PulD (secretin)
MQFHHDETRRLQRNCACTLIGLAMALMLLPQSSPAQTPSAAAKPAEISQTFFLKNITQPTDAMDIQNAVRNVIPRASVYWSASEGALTIRANADEMPVAQKMIDELDQPKKSYRVTYTITDTDGGKRTGSQTFTLIVAGGRKTYLKQGSRIPIVTATGSKESSAQNSQVQYLDVGLNIEASVDGFLDGARLRSKVEQSSLADEKSGVGSEDPVIHQTTLEGTSALTPGKPVLLGSLDVPGSTRRQQIEVVSEVVQ